MGLDAALVGAAALAALALRPWRMVAARGPAWPWTLWWALMPLLWSVDRVAQAAVVQPLSGASLLVLMAGWPLAVLAMLGTAIAAVVLGPLDAWQALHRLAWLGVVPATLVMALGAVVRRWLPRHLFVYIFARGFFGTLLATAAAGWLALAHTGAAAGLSEADLLLGRWLAAWGEAIVTGMLVSIFVAFRPQWLATYSDSLYLPRT